MRRHSVLLATALALMVSVGPACSDDDDSAGGAGGAGADGTTTTAAQTPVPPETSPGGPPATATPAPTTAPPSGLRSARVKLTRVATLTQPVALAVRPDDDTLYVAEKTGRVRAVKDGRVSGTVIDLSDAITAGGEQGLLGLTFSRDGSRLYVNYTDTRGDSRVVEYAFSGDRADESSRRELLFVDQPFSNHNGGNLVLGPDGMLWIGFGDGGGADDPMGNAQSLDRLLGKMLRIDPTPAGDRPYTVPGDNPFAGGGGRPEIWAYGLRNPWRYSFDRATGDLWIGDVGATSREEIDFQPATSDGGENYGWPLVEGTRRRGAPPAGAVAPIKDYARGGDNCSVTGGYVYRGTRIPALAGAYVYGDYCAGQLQALTQSGGRVTAERSLGVEVPALSSFGEDAAGNLYALSLEGSLFRIDPA